MPVPDIFISYNHGDIGVARLFADAFTGEGLDVWWDATVRSGEAYDKVTEAALRGAKSVVVLWSSNSVESRWVRAEATIAERNGTFMPVMIEPCIRPIMFELTQTADLTHWRGETEDARWLAFLDDVQQMVKRNARESAVAPDFTVQPSDGISIIAVLPATHRADDADLEILAEDFTEDFTRELAKNRFFEVIAAGTMAAWRGKPVDYWAIGRQLHARYLVEGKLQRAGEIVRLTVQVIDTESTRMICSQRYVRQMQDITSAPDEFPTFVAADLGERIAQIEGNRAMNKAGPYSAWEHLLRAMAYGTRMSSDAARRGIEEARSAIAAAPNLGLAHAFLATQLGTQEWHPGQQLDEATRREIQKHIQRALQLEGDNCTVISWLTGAYTDLGDGETCLRLARRAVELEPGLPRSHHMLGQAYMELGRTADAIGAFRAMDRLVAFHNYRYLALAMLGTCYLLEGMPEEAEVALDQSLALHPDFVMALTWKAIVAAERGNQQTALATIRRLKEVEPTVTIDQHVVQINRARVLAERTAEHVATLRHLWNVTGDEQ